MEDPSIYSASEDGVLRAEGTLQESVDRAVADRIRSALAEANGRESEAAARLGIERTTLFQWMKRLGLP